MNRKAKSAGDKSQEGLVEVMLLEGDASDPSSAVLSQDCPQNEPILIIEPDLNNSADSRSRKAISAE